MTSLKNTRRTVWPWKYQVKEADVPKYNVTPSNGTVSGSNDGKNTIKYGGSDQQH